MCEGRFRQGHRSGQRRVRERLKSPWWMISPSRVMTLKVVEVLDCTVTPWFAPRDEPGCDPEIEAGRNDRSEVLPGGLDPFTEVGVVVRTG